MKTSSQLYSTRNSGIWVKTTQVKHYSYSTTPVTDNIGEKYEILTEVWREL